MAAAESINTEYVETTNMLYADEVQERLKICRERRGCTLDLSGLGVDRFPEDIFDLKNLTYLNLSENNISLIPDFIGGFKRLEYLNLSFNRITTLPETIEKLECLTTFNVRNNEISMLPEAIGCLTSLKSLDISHNKLSALPQSFDKLTLLTQCEIKGNSFHGLPEKIIILTKPQRLNLLGHIEKIVEIIQGNGFSETSLLNVQPHSEYVARKLHITPIQSVLFSGMLCWEDGVTIEQFSHKYKCNLISLLKYTDDFNELKNKRLIRKQKDYHFNSRTTYYISGEVREFLFKDEEYIPETFTNISLEELFPHIWKLFNRRVEKNELTYEELGTELESLLDNNSHLQFVKKIKSYNLSLNDNVMLLRFCSYLVNLDEPEMSFGALEEVYDSDSDFTFHKKNLKHGKHALIVKGIIENTGGDGFRDAKSFRLTDNTKRELFAEIKLSSVLKGKDITHAEKIQEKKSVLQ